MQINYNINEIIALFISVAIGTGAYVGFLKIIEKIDPKHFEVFEPKEGILKHL